MRPAARTLCQLFALVMICGAARPAAATTINFDDVAVAPGFGVGVASNHYAGGAATIRTILDVTDSLAVGDVFTAQVYTDGFAIVNLGSASSSPPNSVMYFRVANGFFSFASDELLVNFATPMNVVSVHTDAALGEFPDVVRLLGLQNLGGNQYRIVSAASGLDNATTPADTLLSIVCPLGCDAVILEQTTEQEAFDDLQFTTVPEPASITLVGLGLAGSYLRRRRRSSN